MSNQIKPPHTPEGTAPARHTPAKGHRTPGNNGGGPPTQAAARKLKPAPRRRKDTANPGPPKAAWRTAHPAEPEPNPAGRGAEPSVYITHPTHGAGARPGKTQPPTANSKATQNAEQCVRHPRKGRRRNRQTPHPQEKTGGGRENGPQAPRRPPTPQEATKRPTKTAPKTGPPKGAPGDHPARIGNTKARAPARRERGHPKHADTHHAGEKKHKQQTTLPGREGMGGQRPRDRRPGQPPTNTTKPQKKKQKGSGGGHPTDRNTRTPLRHRRRPRMGGGKRGTRRTAHTPQQHLPKERRGAAQTRTPTHTPTPHTRTRNGGEQEERAHSHARPRTLTRTGGVQADTQPNRKDRELQRGKEGRNHKPYPNTPTQDPSHGWRGYQSPNPSTTRTQAQTLHNSKKPSVHSPGTEAARAMQVTRPNEIRSPGVRLHPKACAALGLEADGPTPKCLGTPVPRTCMHAFGTGYARRSGEPLGSAQKRGRAQARGHTLPARQARHAGSDEPSGCCLGPLCWGLPVRCSAM